MRAGSRGAEGSTGEKREGEGGGGEKGGNPPGVKTAASLAQPQGAREGSEREGREGDPIPRAVRAAHQQALVCKRAAGGTPWGKGKRGRGEEGERAGRVHLPGARISKHKGCASKQRERGGRERGRKRGREKGREEKRGGREGRASWRVPGPKAVGEDVVPAARRSTPSIHDVARERRERRETMGQPVGQTEGPPTSGPGSREPESTVAMRDG
jgi:hypothetical protein